MKTLKFIVYSNLWISFGAFFLAYLVFAINGIETNFNYLFFVFFSTLFSYNLQRVSRLKQIKKSSPNAWISNNSTIAKGLLIASFFGALVTVPVFNYPFLGFWLAILGLISAGYSLKNLRGLPYLKIILISLSWAIACGLIPSLFLNEAPASLIIKNTLWVFLYILAITIPFDIRDVGIDEDHQKTIPQWVGIPKSKLIGLYSLVIALVPLFFLTCYLVFFGFIIAFTLAWLLIRDSFPEKQELYFSFMIDGHIILQFLLLFFLC